ncbi:aquaporin family protein [Geodermatophilus sp. YIM 151500]|uniref:MIP/aquaporin family protein n=1 Tax=Geodermatophilus sp. YIM 151500 TaxID=2984531 RepID=UPI0021E41ED7|nr:MIP/aquaporin family protein [Geodermatophilus sp. YIM 151500]MCV2488371.1 aquaporin family protein [Geodermatophilus sp. YIM 151500]
MRLTVLARQSLAEFLGSAGLVTVVIGSGIAAQRLSPDDVGLQLLQNAVVTGAGLVALILAFGPVSGGHFNPVVTLAARAFGGVGNRQVAAYLSAQVVGGVAGALLANLMFGLPAVTLSTRDRSGGGLWLSEAVATFGLVVLVFGLVRAGRAGLAPFAVGSYITAAYWWSSSTSFANPMIDVARTLSDTFAGIAPASVPMFLVMQLVGGAVAVAVVALLYPQVAATAGTAVVPHDGAGPSGPHHGSRMVPGGPDDRSEPHDPDLTLDAAGPAAARPALRADGGVMSGRPAATAGPWPAVPLPQPSDSPPTHPSEETS